VLPKAIRPYSLRSFFPVINRLYNLLQYLKSTSLYDTPQGYRFMRPC
jgi:hypothetical protein